MWRDERPNAVPGSTSALSRVVTSGPVCDRAREELPRAARAVEAGVRADHRAVRTEAVCAAADHASLSAARGLRQPEAMDAAAAMLDITPAEVEGDGVVLHAALPAPGRQVHAAGLPRPGLHDQRCRGRDGVLSREARRRASCRRRRTDCSPTKRSSAWRRATVRRACRSTWSSSTT